MAMALKELRARSACGNDELDDNTFAQYAHLTLTSTKMNFSRCFNLREWWVATTLHHSILIPSTSVIRTINLCLKTLNVG